VRSLPPSWWRAALPRCRRLSAVVGRFLAGACLLLVAAADAHALTARLRWLPSTGAPVAGYDVFVRRSGEPYGAAIDAGLPSVGAGGALAHDVGNLADGFQYYFTVRARGADGTRSACGGELLLGAPDGCRLESCCPGQSCTFGAALDGTPCDDTDACRLCRNGACDTPTESVLDTLRLKVSSRASAPRVVATGTFPVAELDPTAEGLSLSLFDDAGAVLVSAFVPPDTMRANRARTSFVLARDRREGTLEALSVRVRNGRAKVRARLGTDPGAGDGPVGWALATGDSCGRSAALACAPTASGLSCR
jgi:hypothetical protein